MKALSCIDLSFRYRYVERKFLLFYLSMNFQCNHFSYLDDFNFSLCFPHCRHDQEHKNGIYFFDRDTTFITATYKIHSLLVKPKILDAKALLFFLSLSFFQAFYDNVGRNCIRTSAVAYFACLKSISKKMSRKINTK